MFGRHSGSIQAALERLDSEAKMDVGPQLQAARLEYFTALDMNKDVDRKKFTYAWCLIHQRSREDMASGAALFEELTSSKEMQRESLFYLATVLYRLGKFTESRKALQGLLQIDPDNRQAQDLKAAVEHVLSRDGAIGLAVLSSAAIAAVAIGAALIKKR